MRSRGATGSSSVDSLNGLSPHFRLRKSGGVAQTIGKWLRFSSASHGGETRTNPLCMHAMHSTDARKLKHGSNWYNVNKVGFTKEMANKQNVFSHLLNFMVGFFLGFSPPVFVSTKSCLNYGMRGCCKWSDIPPCLGRAYIEAFEVTFHVIILCSSAVWLHHAAEAAKYGLFACIIFTSDFTRRLRGSVFPAITFRNLI